MKTILKFFIALVLMPFCAQSQYFHNKKELIINSKYLKDKATILVKLPEDFEKNKTQCSLLVLLDGDEYFGVASDTESLLQYAEKMPPTVVVAIPSTIENRWKYYTPTKSKNISGDKDNDTLFESSGHFEEFSDFI